MRFAALPLFYFPCPQEINYTLGYHAQSCRNFLSAIRQRTPPLVLGSQRLRHSLSLRFPLGLQHLSLQLRSQRLSLTRWNLPIG
jgi:hypothetical protein